MKKFVVPTLIAVSFIFAACNKDEKRVEGARVSVLTAALPVVKASPKNKQTTKPLSLPKGQAQADWPQVMGGGSHAGGVIAGTSELKSIAQFAFGQGSTSDTKLVTAPVTNQGVVYVMDTDLTIAALRLEGNGFKQLWKTSVLGEHNDQPSRSGGLALAEGKVIATTGTGVVYALESESGKILWQQKISAPVSSAPTIQDGRIFVISMENQTLALELNTGKIVWTHYGVPETARLLGGATPACTAQFVIVTYSSGEVVALRQDSGQVVWTQTMGGNRKTDILSSLADIVASPVIVGNRVFITAHAGRTVAFDLRNGQKLWEKQVGSVRTPWVAGDLLLLTSKSGELMALSAQDGETFWSVPLAPVAADDTKKNRLRWSTPLLIDQNVVVTNDQGQLVRVDAQTGQIAATLKLEEPVLLTPAFSQNHLYFVADNGKLLAYEF